MTKKVFTIETPGVEDNQKDEMKIVHVYSEDDLYAVDGRLVWEDNTDYIIHNPIDFLKIKSRKKNRKMKGKNK